jgi:hypothetical protein
MAGRRYAIIEAPSILGLPSTGAERLGQCLLNHGLAERLNARYAGRVDRSQRPGVRWRAIHGTRLDPIRAGATGWQVTDADIR